MASKVMDIAAAAGLVADGDTVAIGGQTLYRRPLAMVRELMRAGRRGLTALGLTLGFETDLLLAAGCLSTVRSGYVGLDVLGLAPHYGRDPGVRIVEETEASVVLGLRATLGHVSFLPFRGVKQTDILGIRPDLRLVRCPYTGEEYVAWPPIRPDFALIHADQADEHGNAVLAANPGIDRLLAAAARRTIVTTEELVTTRAIQARKATILGRHVAAVVPVPYGAHPTGCYPRYRADIPFLLDYLAAAKEGRMGELLTRLLALDSGQYAAQVVGPGLGHLVVAGGAG